MTDEEKLERIKATCGYDLGNTDWEIIAFRRSDLEWLIDQAERVKKLENDSRVGDSIVKTMDSNASHREDRLMSALKSKSSYRKQRNRLEREMDILEQKLNRCRKTLEFYADPNNYKEIDQYMSSINVDSGVRARKELGG